MEFDEDIENLVSQLIDQYPRIVPYVQEYRTLERSDCGPVDWENARARWKADPILQEFWVKHLGHDEVDTAILIIGVRNREDIETDYGTFIDLLMQAFDT